MIAIFVKTPGRSPVKTRLARGVGRNAAEAWYLRAAQTVAASARVCEGATVYWSVAEDDAHESWLDLPRLSQGEGGLGERLSRVHDALVARHGCGIVLGADTPQIETQQLQRALDWLAAPVRRRVVGPAKDGGFWLFGANHALSQRCFSAVAYSRSDTLAALRRSLDHNADPAELLTLEVLADVDTAIDLTHLSATLRSLVSPTPAQSKLLAWMEASRLSHIAASDAEVVLRSALSARREILRA